MEQVVNQMQKQKVADWGNYPVVEAETVRFDQVDQLQAVLGEPGEVIAHGWAEIWRCLIAEASNHDTFIPFVLIV